MRPHSQEEKPDEGQPVAGRGEGCLQGAAHDVVWGDGTAVNGTDGTPMCSCERSDCASKGLNFTSFKIYLKRTMAPQGLQEKKH